MTNKVGIIVPYRDRPDQLAYFLAGTQQYLHSNGIDHEIIIVEQDFASEFNRGMLCNIGFTVAKKRRCSHVVFHDVDLIPVDVDYSYSHLPFSLISDNLPFRSYFGGATMFPIEDFEAVNGFSNFYWGWGFEDDDLLYRCHKNGNIKLDKWNEYPQRENNITAHLNGVDAYIKVGNIIDYRKSFAIEVLFRKDKVEYDPNRDSDIYNIFSTCSRDTSFTLYYSSFGRLSLQAFDLDENIYSITSDILDNIEFKARIEYDKTTNSLSLTVNGEQVGTVKIKKELLNYERSRFLRIGADAHLKNFFKGAVDTFKIFDQDGLVITDLDSTNVVDYKVVDKSHNKNNGRPVKIDFRKYSTDHLQPLYIPYRRKSKFKKLDHDSNGFTVNPDTGEGMWKSKLTRWNQLRFNNEVLNGGHDEIEDGLTTLTYTKHSTQRFGNITFLRVGI